MIPLKEMQRVELFVPLSEKMIEELASIGEVLEAPKGELLFRQGDKADKYYILKEGKVELTFRHPDGTVEIETVEPGMGVGCSALAGLSTYQAEGVCEEPSRFLVWSQKDLRHLFNEDSRLGYLMVKASARLLHKRKSRTIHQGQK